MNFDHGDAIVTIKPGQVALRLKTGARCCMYLSNIGRLPRLKVDINDAPVAEVIGLGPRNLYGKWQKCYSMPSRARCKSSGKNFSY